MTKISLTGHPFLLGFDQLERLAERAAKGESYPPYNVEQTAPDAFLVSLAVAGFGEADLAIMLEGRQLSIHGKSRKAEGDRVFLHQGIASRGFQRNFILAEGIEVTGAILENGMLSIMLHRREPDLTIRTIPISRP